MPVTRYTRYSKMTDRSSDPNEVLNLADRTAVTHKDLEKNVNIAKDANRLWSRVQ